MNGETIVAPPFWRDGIRQRIEKLFPNQGVHWVATLMADSHPYAIQYIEQAPVLVLLASGGRCLPRSGRDREYVARTFGSAVYRAPKLKALMGMFSAPLPLRKIHPFAVIPSRADEIRLLCRLAPSPLSQAIPEKPGEQRLWLKALARWRSKMDRNWQGRQDRQFEWAAVALGNAIGTMPADLIAFCDDVVDYVLENKIKLTSAITYRAARAAMERWHVELGKRQTEEAFLLQHGKRFDDPVDYEDLPLDEEADGLRFLALRSGLDLFTEGVAMRNCVATYVRHVILGGIRIYSIRSGENRVATAELHPKGNAYVLAQLKGPCNSRPKADLTRAVQEFVHRLNEGRGTP